VTGGTGFIGRRVVRMLLEGGWAVRVFVPEAQRTKLPAHARVEPIVGDVTRPETLRGTMDEVDGVFHMAALVEFWVRRPSEFFRVNVLGTDHVIDEALRAGVPRFVFTSSISGIGVTPGQPVREDSSPGRVFGPYEESKAEAERHIARACVERGLPALTLIPGIVLGPGDTRNTGRFLLSFVKGEFPGTFAEESFLPVVDVGDVARAHLLAFERGRVGERYIISGENRRWGDLLRAASVLSGTPVPSRHIGGRALWLASRTGEAWARVTRLPPRLPAWLADFLLTGATMDNTKSIRELGMTYRPIEESIRETIDWFQEEGLVPRKFPSVAPPPIGLPVENPQAGIDLESAPTNLDATQQARTRDRRPKPPEGGH
jgi:dihydroflavonol-4-reductase